MLKIKFRIETEGYKVIGSIGLITYMDLIYLIVFLDYCGFA